MLLDRGGFSGGYRLKFVTLMFVSGLLNFTDRNLYPVLAQAIKQDLVLSDFQLGLLGGLGFALVYTLTGLPVARLADRRNRIAIVAWATGVWSLFCILCGLAQNFWQLLLGRAGLGVGEAGFLPASTSLVGDHYPPAQRASILSIIQLGSPASTLLCAAIAAWIGQQWGWRAALIAVGVPGLLVAVAVQYMLREPQRGLYDADHENTALPWRVSIGLLLQKRAFVYVMFGAALVTFCVNAIAQFYVAYFVRIHHWTLAQGGFAFGVIQCTAATVGLLFGGFGVDWLARRDERWRCWIPAIGVSIATVLYVAAFQQSQALAAAALILVGGIFLFTFYMPSIGMIQSMASAHSRATAIAIFSLAGTLLGMGLGPVASGLASDIFAARDFAFGDFATLCPGGQATAGASAAIQQACLAASASGLEAALLLSPLPLLLSALLYLLAARTLREDVSAVAAGADRLQVSTSLTM
jgi:predicted MFS family arabinose efflux permease